jgi:hypothetical protein
MTARAVFSMEGDSLPLQTNCGAKEGAVDNP